MMRRTVLRKNADSAWLTLCMPLSYMNAIASRAATRASPATVYVAPYRRRWANRGLRLAAWVCTLALASLSAPVARACPDCDIGQVARAQFWSDNFAGNLATALAPFAVVIAVSLLAERMGRSTKHSRSAEVSHER
jgi:hypothetical protein